MRIRRAQNAGDLRTAPIDGVDVFLLTRVVDTMPLSELQEIAPCRPDEVASRIKSLSALGLVEVIPSPAEERRRPIVLSLVEDPDESVTLRPPASPASVSEDALTLWPPMNAPLKLDLDDFADPPHTGIRLRPPPNFAELLDPSQKPQKR